MLFADELSLKLANSLTKGINDTKHFKVQDSDAPQPLNLMHFRAKQAQYVYNHIFIKQQ